MNAQHQYFIVLTQTPARAWWPVALIVGLAIFFAWWLEHYTRDKF